METKICIGCSETKPLSDFHNKKSSKDGKQARCKTCNITKVKDWQEDNKERFEDYWKARDIEAYTAFSDAWWKRKARKYSISVDELKILFEATDGKCEICLEIPDRWLVVDHCHTSLKVRGILCERCNQALGLFKDNTTTLENAIKYLNKGL